MAPQGKKQSKYAPAGNELNEEGPSSATASGDTNPLTEQLRHYAERLEVLNELNQLIVSDVDLDRIARTVARESAFRFSADCSFALLLSDTGDYLELKGSYGCALDALPEKLPLQDSVIGRALQVGGMLSVPDLTVHSNHNLDFLAQVGIRCLHCTSLEVKGEILGALVIGFRIAVDLSELSSSMFEEFAQGAAVAIANARVQHRLTAYTERLEELVEQRTADLAIQTARAEAASAAKSRFIANMSHELRTPLTAIVGYTNVLADGLYGQLNEKQKEALQSITKSSEHLRTLIDDVLNLSRIESGEEDPNPDRVALQAVLKQVYKLMLQTAVGKGVKLSPLEIDEQYADVQLWVDPRHIRQILINLMSNAVKYTKAGGRVTLDLKLTGDKAQIFVRDTGVGISPENLEKLFNRFERGSDSYSRDQVGTGIGLSLTKHLTEINGGKIGVESSLNQGSTFWVLVPLADASSLADEPEEDLLDSSSADLRLNGLNVLIVDDSMMTCQLLEAIVTKAGATPHVALNVPDAKTAVENTDIDAALIDLAMPGENGLDLLDYFRNECSEPLSTIPLIVVSACVFDKDREEAKNHGASHFIAKPFRPHEIISTIRRLTTSSVLRSSGILKAR